MIAGLLFVAQSGILVHQHFCKEQLMGTRLFVKAPTCHQPVEGKSCPMHASAQKTSKPCCDDRANYESADLSGFAVDLVQFEDIDLVKAPAICPALYFNENIPGTAYTGDRILRPPPNLTRHISLYQVFRC